MASCSAAPRVDRKYPGVPAGSLSGGRLQLVNKASVKREGGRDGAQGGTGDGRHAGRERGLGLASNFTWAVKKKNTMA